MNGGCASSSWPGCWRAAGRWWRATAARRSVSAQAGRPAGGATRPAGLRRPLRACHGAKLEGQPNWRDRDASGRLPAPPHDPSGHTWHHPDEQLFALTKHGVAKVANLKDYQSNMPAYEGVLSDAEIVAVLSWIKAQWPAEIQGEARPDQPGRAREPLKRLLPAVRRKGARAIPSGRVRYRSGAPMSRVAAPYNRARHWGVAVLSASERSLRQHTWPFRPWRRRSSTWQDL